MASACKSFISRSSSSIKSAFRTNGPKSPFSRSAAAPSSTRSSLPFQSTSPLRRFTFSRCPSELGCAYSLLPLHSAVAAARLSSCLSSTSRSCRALSQGTLCCTYPGL
ncbi:aquaporin TIP2-3 [Hibiscus syriacus]|uniref:Aquaporin TIP2-3 n=1 Tax=Hibiscus syriacus TaxID=106335 RepID=A0A6A3CJI7_HIBSY|nr:aquaporin TIP2-3 [Hibiscus syriacus]